MRALRSVRENERVSSTPGRFAITNYRLKAPNRFAYKTNGGVKSIVIGATQWERPDLRMGWQRGRFGGGLPFRTRSWFNWSTYARSIYLLGSRTEGGRRVAVVGLMDPGTPGWWQISIDPTRDLVLRSRLVTNGHFMSQRYYAFNRPETVRPPKLAAHDR